MWKTDTWPLLDFWKYCLIKKEKKMVDTIPFLLNHWCFMSIIYHCFYKKTFWRSFPLLKHLASCILVTHDGFANYILATKSWISIFFDNRRSNGVSIFSVQAVLSGTWSCTINAQWKRRLFSYTIPIYTGCVNFSNKLMKEYNSMLRIIRVHYATEDVPMWIWD